MFAGRHLQVIGDIDPVHKALRRQMGRAVGAGGALHGWQAALRGYSHGQEHQKNQLGEIFHSGMLNHGRGRGRYAPSDQRLWLMPDRRERHAADDGQGELQGEIKKDKKNLLAIFGILFI